jgi:hypothetical protein
MALFGIGGPPGAGGTGAIIENGRDVAAAPMIEVDGRTQALSEPASTLKPGPMVEERLIFLM